MHLSKKLACVMVALSLVTPEAPARFAVQVQVAGKQRTGTHTDVNARGGGSLKIESIQTKSRNVQMADVIVRMKIPSSTPVIDLAAVRYSIGVQNSHPNIHYLFEVWNFKSKRWHHLHLFEADTKYKEQSFGLKGFRKGKSQTHVRDFIDGKTFEMRLRIRTKREAVSSYFIMIDYINLLGIRGERMNEYGDLFGEPEVPDRFKEHVKRLKDDWAKSFNNHGKVIAINDWESTEERKEQIRKDWEDNWNKRGKLKTMEDAFK
jgi:hypothetical protein